jgi:hypothetical protein
MKLHSQFTNILWFFRVCHLRLETSNENHNDESLTSVCASLALSTFCASAQTLSRGTARCGTCDFPSLSLSLPSLSACRQHYIIHRYMHSHVGHYLCHTVHIIREWVLYVKKVKRKRKTIRVTGHGGPYGRETSRPPRFLDNRLIDGSEVVTLKHWTNFTLSKIPGTHSC